MFLRVIELAKLAAKAVQSGYNMKPQTVQPSRETGKISPETFEFLGLSRNPGSFMSTLKRTSDQPLTSGR